ncbi:hypothetical protein [Aquifex aeolicus]|uniref:Uncharacterized protein aq_1525 n=1 Tax=Aquifex aeolicus (strain VF5) TaxID=224324 RepID=Y1525_AQUAE|nr:hypothetical protein [Aquifex aeolicus]O67485.1 RecName: Full=Uncharacterized protein aq_1525 [Aquifex aeolicus VF5]AAC07451.1 putative protein [Aquifex aeolicus VF5]
MEYCRDLSEKLREVIRKETVKLPIQPIQIISIERHEFKVLLNKKGIKIVNPPNLTKNLGVYLILSFRLKEKIREILGEKFEHLIKVLGDIISDNTLETPLITLGEGKNLKKKFNEEFIETLENASYSNEEAGKLREFLKTLYALALCNSREEITLDLCVILLHSEQHATLEKQLLSLVQPLLKIDKKPKKELNL